MAGKDFRTIYNMNLEHIEKELFRPIKNKKEYDENIDYLARILKAVQFFNKGSGIYLSCTKRAYQGEPVFLCLNPERFLRIRSYTIFGISCNEIARVELENPFTSQDMGGRIEVSHVIGMLKEAVKRNNEYICSYGTVEELANGDDLIMMHRHFRK